MTTEVILVLTTTATADDARRIARTLVERRLAACVQTYGPLESTYWWKEQVETATEWQCVAKTRRELYSQVEQAIRAQHTYETPEILAIPVVAGSAAYLSWLNAELAHDKAT